FYNLVKRPVSRFQQAQNLNELCQIAVEEIQKISGFDRTMVYRFDTDGSGQVVAEAKRPGLEPYLGLHYPATDIPVQAKHLYALNKLRAIPDVTYEPVPLIAHKTAPPRSVRHDLQHAAKCLPSTYRIFGKYGRPGNCRHLPRTK
ncbi:MAG: hypothetical protein AAFU53_07680, partial [Cyanobacteria bacterium J06632_3]